MARYTVHLPGKGDDLLGRARFVADGVAPWAFLFGPFWLIAKGAWISGVIMLACHLGFAVLVAMLSLPPVIGLIGHGVIQFAIALEGSSLRRWELGLAGWDEAGLVVGDDLDTLERRFFADHAGASGMAGMSDSAPGTAVPGPASYPLGTFPLGSFPSGPRPPARSGH